MPDRPRIKSADWIRIGQTDCVVVQVHEGGDVGALFGHCEVVFNPDKPTNRQVHWDGEKWEFVEAGDYGGYAENSRRLSKFIQILKRGRNA